MKESKYVPVSRRMLIEEDDIAKVANYLERCGYNFSFNKLGSDISFIDVDIGRENNMKMSFYKDTPEVLILLNNGRRIKLHRKFISDNISILYQYMKSGNL